MKSFDYFFVFAFASLFSVQPILSAEIAERKFQTKLGVFAENGAVVSNTLFGSFVDTLDKIQPNVVAILNEMSPEVKEVLYGVLGATRAKFGEEQKLVEKFFDGLLKSLERLKPIETCTNEFSPKFDELSRSFETDLLETVRKVLERNGKDLENIKAGSAAVAKKFRDVLDKVTLLPGCLSPGNKEASSCLGDKMEEIIQGLVDAVANSNLFGESLRDVFETLVSDVLSDSIPSILKMMGSLLGVLEGLGDCVSGLQ